MADEKFRAFALGYFGISDSDEAELTEKEISLYSVWSGIKKLDEPDIDNIMSLCDSIKVGKQHHTSVDLAFLLGVLAKAGGPIWNGVMAALSSDPVGIQVLVVAASTKIAFDRGAAKSFSECLSFVERGKSDD